MQTWKPAFYVSNVGAKYRLNYILDDRMKGNKSHTYYERFPIFRQSKGTTRCFLLNALNANRVCEDQLPFQALCSYSTMQAHLAQSLSKNPHTHTHNLTIKAIFANKNTFYDNRRKRQNPVNGLCLLR